MALTILDETISKLVNFAPQYFILRGDPSFA